MHKKRIRSLAAFLAVLLIVSVLAGCNNEPIDETKVEETTGISEETFFTPETDTPETEAETTAESETTEAVAETETETVETTAPVTETEAPVETAPPHPVSGHVSVTGITLTTYEVNLAAGDTQMPWVTMYPANATDKGEIWTSSDTSVATVDMYGNITGVGTGSCTVTVKSKDNPSVYADVAVKVSGGVTPTYIDGILVVNKTYALPKSYAPGWDAEASNQIWAMFAAAKAEGLNMRVQSGYRSYVDQRIIYNNYVARDGQAAADRYSARPGHSEHQSGLAFDLNTYYYDGLTQAFGECPEGKWLAENCHKFGFIIRYPKDKEHITGYMYEPWHVRYLGVEKATAVYESGLCLEEYLGITSSYS